MLLAITKNKERIKPTRECDAFCPSCIEPVIAKMGKLKIHHWAHKEKTDCTYGRGMTEWHYKWIDRHYQKQGWDIEHIDGDRRYDCFNAEKKLVLEIQKKPAYEYITEKTQFVLDQGYCINWIFHEDILASFQKTPLAFEAPTLRRLVILDLLEELSGSYAVRFFLDSSANSSNGASSRGLLRLYPAYKKNASYSNYYRVPYTALTTHPIRTSHN